jgi:prolyl-tRNA editing enzyme YbaK/EbsC (Cys-tRNA(Pro) deacylase)
VKVLILNSSVKTWRSSIEGIEVEVLEFTDTVETVEKASRLSGYPVSQIVKTLLLKAGRDYIVIVARGDRKIDLEKAKQILGTKTTLATPREVNTVLGVEVGAVTPYLPRIKSLRVILDPAILEHEYIVCGGGSLNRLYKVKTRDLLKYLNPEIIDIFMTHYK